MVLRRHRARCLLLRSGDDDAPGARRIAESCYFLPGRAEHGAVEGLDGKVPFRRPAPKGASDFQGLSVSLKRYPDTKPDFFRTVKACHFKQIQTDPLLRSKAAFQNRPAKLTCFGGTGTGPAPSNT